MKTTLVCASKIANLLPLPLAYFLTDAVGWAAFLIMRKRSQITTQNMLHITDGDSLVARRLARESFQSYAAYALDFLKVLSISGDDYIRDIRTQVTIVGGEIAERARTGKGLIAVGLHAGMWDFGPAAASQILGMPASVVIDQFEDERLNFLLQKIRSLLGISLISSGNGALQIRRELRKNNLVNILIDVPPEGKDAITVTFFGSEVDIHSGPARMCLLSGASLVVGIPFRQKKSGNLVRLVIQPVEYESTGEIENDVRGLSQELMLTLEHLIRQDPSQWHMFRHFWTSDRFTN